MSEDQSREIVDRPFGGIVSAIASPGKTFESIVRKPTWWAPFLIGLVLSALFSFFMTQKVDVEGSIRAKIEQNSARSGQKMAPQDIDHAVEMQTKVIPFYPVFGAVGFTFFFFLAALILGAGGRAFGAEASWPAFFGLYAYASVPNLAKALVGIGRLLVAEPYSLTFESLKRLSPSNPAVLLPAAAPPALTALFGSLDLFTAATLLLLIIGFRKIPGLSKGVATAVPLILWGLTVAIGVGWAAIFG